MVNDEFYPLRYAFIHGPALFVSLDDTKVGALSRQQMTWLDDVLSSHSQQPVKFVYGHLPIVPFAQGREDEIIGDLELEALLKRHSVTAFISGHHHSFYPGRRDTLRHYSMACLGSSPRRLIGEDEVRSRAVAVIEYSREGLHRFEAWEGPAFERATAHDTFPMSLEADGWVTVRDDSLHEP